MNGFNANSRCILPPLPQKWNYCNAMMVFCCSYRFLRMSSHPSRNGLGKSHLVVEYSNVGY